MQHAIVFLDRESVDANVRKPNFPHSYKEYDSTWTKEEIVDRLKDATIAIINKVPMREDVLKALPNLKLIAVAATGTDVVDKAYCKKHGITVSNIRNYAFNTVPEHVIALIFALRRNLFSYVEDTRNGVWNRVEPVLLPDASDPRHRGLDARHRRLWRDRQVDRQARRGARHEGASLRRRAAAGPRRFRHDPAGERHHYPARAADAETKNMIGAAEFKKMKPTAILINTARGGLVDEAALAQALRDGTIAGAGFDVLTVEPPKGGNVLLDPTIPNLIVTPHVAWASQEAMQILGRSAHRQYRGVRGRQAAERRRVTPEETHI